MANLLASIFKLSLENNEMNSVAIVSQANIYGSLCLIVNLKVVMDIHYIKICIRNVSKNWDIINKQGLFDRIPELVAPSLSWIEFRKLWILTSFDFQKVHRPIIC